jgi:hypothetical protein
MFILKSRKFWLAVFGVVQTIVLHYLSIPQDIWVAIDALVVVLIYSIAVEDAGAKAGGAEF